MSVVLMYFVFICSSFLQLLSCLLWTEYKLFSNFSTDFYFSDTFCDHFKVLNNMFKKLADELVHIQWF